MNHNTLKYEGCDHSCSTCTGPLPTDCLTCRGALQVDSAHGCVPCCSSNGNNVETEFAVDCCQCLTSNGPCSSKDKVRSIENYDSYRHKVPSSGGLFSGLGFVLFICFAVVFAAGFVLLKGTNIRRTLSYSKVTSNYTRRRQKENIERKLNYIYENDDDDDDEDDCELMLYEKT